MQNYCANIVLCVFFVCGWSGVFALSTVAARVPGGCGVFLVINSGVYHLYSPSCSVAVPVPCFITFSVYEQPLLVLVVTAFVCNYESTTIAFIA